MIKHQGPLFEEAGGGSGGGGDQGSLLTATAGSQQGGTPPATQTLPPDPAKWREYLSPEYKEHPSLQSYKDVNGAVKTLLSLEKMLGGEKIPAPRDDWTPEQWNTYYTRLGRPESPDKYAFKLAEGFPADDAIVKEMTKVMYDAGLTTKQVAAVMEGYSGRTVAQLAELNKAQAKAAQDTEAALRQEFGEKFGEELNYARYAVKELGDEATIKSLNETHLTNNGPLVKLMAKAGRLLAGDRAKGGGTGGGDPDANLQPAEAQAQLQALLSDESNKKALFDSNDPKHEAVKARRWKLIQLASRQPAS